MYLGETTSQSALLSFLGKRANPGRTMMVLDVSLIFITEVAKRTVNGVRAGLSQTAKAAFLHHEAQLFEPWDGVRVCSTVGDLLEHAMHLDRAAPAGTTLAAALIHAEFHEELGHIGDTAGFIHDDQATGPHD